MNDVQSLMTAAAMLVMGGFGLFMYKSDEHDEVAFENPLLKKVEEKGGLRGQGPRGEQNFVPFFQKGYTPRDTHVEKQEIQEKTDEEIETEIKPKKTRKMRKRGPSGGSIRRF